MKIRWTNQFSHEQGYVKSVDYKMKHFNSTENEKEAKQFTSIENAQKTIDKLIEYGEGELNVFEIL